jgi:hypothetical protein
MNRVPVVLVPERRAGGRRYEVGRLGVGPSRAVLQQAERSPRNLRVQYTKTHTGSLELTTYSAMITGQDWSTAWKIPYPEFCIPRYRTIVPYSDHHSLAPSPAGGRGAMGVRPFVGGFSRAPPGRLAPGESVIKC